MPAAGGAQAQAAAAGGAQAVSAAPPPAAAPAAPTPAQAAQIQPAANAANEELSVREYFDRKTLLKNELDTWHHTLVTLVSQTKNLCTDELFKDDVEVTWLQFKRLFLDDGRGKRSCLN